MEYEKIRLCCDFIKDRDLFKAVIFSVKLIRDGVDPRLAHSKAAKYYNVRLCDVAKYCGQHAVRTKENRRGIRREYESCED